MHFLYIQYYMRFYEIWCFLKNGYIWNRQQCGDISSIYVKRYLFRKCHVWKLVVLSVDIPDSGIWMVCCQGWWSEMGCCELVVIWDGLVVGTVWLRRAGVAGWQAGGGRPDDSPVWWDFVEFNRRRKNEIAWCGMKSTLMAMSRRSGMVDAIGGEVVLVL